VGLEGPEILKNSPTFFQKSILYYDNNVISLGLDTTGYSAEWRACLFRGPGPR